MRIFRSFGENFFSHKILIMLSSSIKRFGFLSGLIILLAFGLTWALGGTRLDWSVSELIGYLSIFLALSLVFLGMRHYREHEAGGRLTFKQGLRVGLLITLFPSVAIFLYTVVFFLVAGEEFVAYAFEQMPEPEQAYWRENRHLLMNPWFQGALMFINVLVIGLVVSVVSAAVLRRK